MNDHHGATARLRAQAQELERLQKGATNEIAAQVAGHRGDSTVSVTAQGSGARVEVEGPDARQQHRAVNDEVKLVLARRGRRA